MQFDVAGPFKLTRHGTKKFITEQTKTDLKPDLEENSLGLSSACGCYVFAIHAGKGYTPYYVGQACKQSVLNEALNPSNREKYNKACSESNGTPVLFVVPMRSPNGRYRKQGGGRGRHRGELWKRRNGRNRPRGRRLHLRWKHFS